MTTWQQQVNSSPVPRPSDIASFPNGQFPASVLVPILDFHGNTVGQSSPTVRRAWTAMIHSAGVAGVFISCRDPGTTPSSSYRSLAEQQQLWSDNYDHIDHGNGSRVWNGQTWYLKPGKNVAAPPGLSNHGLTLAFDTNVEVPGVLPWLESNAINFGFQWEVPSEAWHIHYYVGDNIPHLVLIFEAGENDMTPEQSAKFDKMDYAIETLILPAVARLEQDMAEIKAAIAKIPHS